MSLDEEPHAWQSPLDNDDCSETVLTQKEISFQSKLLECESFQFYGTKHPDGTWKQRVLELSELCYERASEFDLHALYLADDAARALVQSANSLRELSQVFANPSAPSMMVRAELLSRHFIEKYLLANNIKLGTQYCYLEGLLKVLPRALYMFHKYNAAILGQRISIEWTLYEFEHVFAVSSARPVKASKEQCGVCHEDFQGGHCSALGFEERCSRTEPSSNHHVHCSSFHVFHSACLAKWYMEHIEGDRLSSCPACDGKWCVQDLVAYPVVVVQGGKRRKVKN